MAIKTLRDERQNRNCGVNLFASQVASLVVCVLLAFTFALPCPAQQPIRQIQRRIPPTGMKVSDNVLKKLREEADAARQRLDTIEDESLKPDVEFVIKAVDYALLHGEFYDKEDTATAEEALKQANVRMDQIDAGNPEWKKQKGRILRGYRSSVDGSVQPYALEIPDNVRLERPSPLYVWLHGRGDKETDLHFMIKRFEKPGQIAPPRAIVLHPFGRQCIGFKSAGEIDVLEAIEHVTRNYRIDRERIILMGFSMGGAGVWHMAAHYPHLWAGASSGAGFAETREYNKIADADLPASYTQTLWQVYDVPYYTRNLFNFPFVAYSGELDKQIQAARVMEKAFKQNGRELKHVIGPEMGHKYDEGSLKKIMTAMRSASKAGRNQDPARGFLQTRTLRYNRAPGIEVMGLDAHWTDTRVDTLKASDRLLRVATRNVNAIRFPIWQKRSGAIIEIDKQQINVDKQSGGENVMLARNGTRWAWAAVNAGGLRKRPGLQGPIDDAFMSSFMVVTPGGKSKSPHVRRYVDFEIERLTNRWRSLFRGELRIKKDWELTDEDVQQHNLILFGDASSNEYLSGIINDLPIKWDDQNLEVSGKQYDSQTSLPLMIYPNPKNQARYVVLNSGPTFRESHDRTNSLQNPQLPDWSVIDLTQLPDDQSPGKVIAADFFDEAWQFTK